MSYQPDLRILFQGVAETMRIQQEKIARQMGHAGEEGESAEFGLADFLRNHLPTKYGVGKGIVIAENGLTGHVCDLVIYDALNCPVIPASKKGTLLFPVESVLAIIEMTTSLDPRKLKDDAKKLAAIKRMPRRSGMRHIVGDMQYRWLVGLVTMTVLAVVLAFAVPAHESSAGSLDQEAARLAGPGTWSPKGAAGPEP